MALGRLFKDRHYLPFARPIRLPPGRDGSAVEAFCDRFEHRFHLAWQPWEDEHVREHEPRRASERVLERFGPAREAGPAGGVIAEAAAFEPCSKLLGDRRNLQAIDPKSRRDGFARD